MPLAVGIAVCLAGCAAAQRPEGAREALRDAEVAGVVHAANRMLLRLGALGQAQAVSGFTREYAEARMREASRHGSELSRLLRQEGLQIAPSPLADALTASLAQALTRLEAAEAVDFDTAFLRVEAEANTRVARLLRGRLAQEATGRLAIAVRNLGRIHARAARDARRTLALSPLTSPPEVLWAGPPIEDTWVRRAGTSTADSGDRRWLR